MSWTVDKALFSEREIEYLEAVGERGRASALRLAVPQPAPSVTKLAVVRSSPEIGAQGEATVLQALGRHFAAHKPGAHSGDLLIEHRGLLLMVEVKQHAAAVPALQVAKFHADADALKADAAMLVSLTSAVVGCGSFALDGARRRLVVQCAEPQAIVAYAELMLGLSAVCVADLDAVESLARKALQSLGRLSTVRSSIHDAERALAAADSALALAEAESSYLLGKLAARAHALTSSELIDESAPSRLADLCRDRFAGSLLVQPHFLEPLAQKMVTLVPYQLAATQTHLTLKTARGSLLVHPQITQVKMTLKCPRRETTIKGRTLADFAELLAQL